MNTATDKTDPTDKTPVKSDKKTIKKASRAKIAGNKAVQKKVVKKRAKPMGRPKHPPIEKLIASLESRVSISKQNKVAVTQYKKAAKSVETIDKRIVTATNAVNAAKERVKQAKTLKAKGTAKKRLASARLKLKEIKESHKSVTRALQNARKLLVAMDKFHISKIEIYNKEAGKLITKMNKLALAKPKKRKRRTQK